MIMIGTNVLDVHAIIIIVSLLNLLSNNYDVITINQCLILAQHLASNNSIKRKKLIHEIFSSPNCSHSGHLVFGWFTTVANSILQMQFKENMKFRDNSGIWRKMMIEILMM